MNTIIVCVVGAIQHLKTIVKALGKRVEEKLINTVLLKRESLSNS